MSAWLVSLALFTPMVAVYAAHFLAAPEGSSGTGFLQYDQFYYMANAREHFDSGSFTLLYGLPNSPSYDTPRLYVQIHSLLLGLAHHLSGWDPGRIYVAFGVVAGLAFLRVAIALYAELLPLTSAARWLGLLCFVWGGGVLTLTGLGTSLATGSDLREALFRFDPAGGYWFLNLGRNLYYATEAYYHVLFLGTVLLLLRRRYAAALATAAALSWSHPFGGIQCLAVVLAWTLGERLWFQRNSFPTWVPGVAATLLLMHVGYYLGILETSPEHRILKHQWSVPAVMSLPTMLAAYLPLAALAAVGGRLQEPLPLRFADPRTRLLAVWLAVSFALANHEIFFEPLQPLHFTRGYVWTPLFLLAAPALVYLLERSLAMRGRTLGRVIAGVVVAIALSDNATWFGRHAWELGARPAIWRNELTDETRRALDILGATEFQRHLVVSNSRMFGYWATVYTPLRSWRSHEFNTPESSKRLVELRQFFTLGSEPPQWREVPLLVVWERSPFPARWDQIAQRAALEPIWSGDHLHLYVRRPEPAAAGEN